MIDSLAGAGSSFGIRAPVQQRSRRVVERILAATHKLLNEEPFEQLTMVHVAGEANVAVGSIYRYYADKEDLLRAAADGFLRNMEEQVAARIAAAEPRIESVVGALVWSYYELMSSRAREMGVFLMNGAGDEVIVNRAAMAWHTIYVAFRAGLERDRERIVHADIDLASRVALQMAIAPFTNYAQSTRYPTLRQVLLTTPRLAVPEVIRAAAGYLIQPLDLAGDRAVGAAVRRAARASGS